VIAAGVVNAAVPPGGGTVAYASPEQVLARERADRGVQVPDGPGVELYVQGVRRVADVIGRDVAGEPPPHPVLLTRHDAGTIVM